MEENHINLLQQIFDNINSWLHFAEAKNAALIAFNVALLAAIMSSNLSETCIFLFSTIAVGLLISTIITLYSFKPINTKLNKTDASNIHENLLHFAYIASLDSEEYIKKIYCQYWNTNSIDIHLIPQIEKDYCEEIIENARITMRKQSLFKKGFYVVLIMIVILGALIICA